MVWRKSSNCIFILLSISCVFFYSPFSHGQSFQPAAQIGIVISLNIQPYNLAAEGILSGISAEPDTQVQIHSLYEYPGERETLLAERIAKEKYDLIIGVGPEAARFMWKNLKNNDIPTVYSMVLTPEGINGYEEGFCGVSMRIPAEGQLRDITRVIPGVKRVGIFYDPDFNRDFVASAKSAAAYMDLSIVDIRVETRKDIARILRENTEEIDTILLIPDRTVITETLVQYIIKKAFLQNIPVIGYNRFFYDSGAAMAFVLDYKGIGEQTAAQALRILSGRICLKDTPAYNLVINEKVIKRLELNAVEKNGKNGNGKARQ